MTTYNCVRYNTYFKGSRDDSFMSGIWIGDVLQQDTVFIMCEFNGVEADFERCTFIDCTNPPKGHDCHYITLSDDVRLTPQLKDSEGEWA